MTDINAILDERQKTHGDFANHARVAQKIKDVLLVETGVCGKSRLTLSWEQQEALDMIAHKIGRILAGDQNHKDHWLDIAGYATLAARSIQSE